MATYILIAILFTSIFGLLYPKILFFSSTLSFIGIVCLWWDFQKKKTFKPKSEGYKELVKLKDRKEKKDEMKHVYIQDQVSYIENKWGFTQEQERVFALFVENRAYSKIYNKLSASLFPQMILLIDDCNAIDKKGCHREVSKRLRELTAVMKDELKKKKVESQESFEVNKEVYDYLLKEV